MYEKDNVSEFSVQAKVSNEELYWRTNTLPPFVKIRIRRWRWIRHVMRRHPGNISRTALHWKPEGKRKREQPKDTWHWTIEEELETLHHTWGTVQKLAQNRQERGTFVAARHASQHSGHEWVRLHTLSTLKAKLFGELGWHSGGSFIPPTNLAKVHILDPASQVGWVCSWFSSLLKEFFSRFSCYFTLTKTTLLNYNSNFK